MENKITKKDKTGLTVTAIINRDIINDVAFADGLNIKLDKKTYERIYITITKNGKKASCRDINFVYILNDAQKAKLNNNDIYARFGDTYISKSVYTIIIDVIAELKKTTKPEGWDVIKKAENDAKKAQEKNRAKEAEEYSKLVATPGYCTKCHTYCYGDCAA